MTSSFGGADPIHQIAVFWILDHWLKNLPARIEAGEMGAATLLSAVKLSVAMISAAAVSG